MLTHVPPPHFRCFKRLKQWRMKRLAALLLVSSLLFYVQSGEPPSLRKEYYDTPDGYFFHLKNSGIFHFSRTILNKLCVIPIPAFACRLQHLSWANRICFSLNHLENFNIKKSFASGCGKKIIYFFAAGSGFPLDVHWEFLHYYTMILQAATWQNHPDPKNGFSNWIRNGTSFSKWIGCPKCTRWAMSH